MGWRRSVATIRMQSQGFAATSERFMASLDSVSIAILLGAVLVMAGILSSLLAPRLGVPVLLVFLIVGMLAGEDGPGGLQLNNYALANLAGTAALAVVLFDGGMRTHT